MSVVTLRPAVAGDCLTVWRWRNDPETRRASFDEAEIPLESHARWFEESLNRADRRIYIVRANGMDAGVVRLDLEGREATVNINIAPEWRGKGVGVNAVRAAASEAFGPLGLVQLVAKVKTANVASRVAFERAGFSIARLDDGVITLVRASTGSCTGRRPRRSARA